MRKKLETVESEVQIKEMNKLEEVFLSVEKEGSFEEASKLLQSWIEKDFTPYDAKYPTKAIAIYNDKVALLFKSPDSTDDVLNALVDLFHPISDKLSFGSDGKLLTINIGDEQIGDLFVGYVTETKAEHSNIDFDAMGDNLQLITNKKLLKELNKSQKTKLTKRKCKDEDDFVKTLKS